MKLKLKFLFYLIYNILIIQVLTQEKGSSLRKTETLSIDFQKNEKITVHLNKEKIIFNCSEFKKDEEIYFKITAKRFIDEKIKFEFLDNLNGYFSIFHNLYNAYYTEKDDGLDKEVNYYTIKKSFYNVRKKYPQITANDYYIDAMAMYLITKTEQFDVIVTTNLFGDILSDLGGGLVRSLGLIPSANIGTESGLFEPVHGSAPDIAGKNIANPCSMILSA